MPPAANTDTGSPRFGLKVRQDRSDAPKWCDHVNALTMRVPDAADPPAPAPMPPPAGADEAVHDQMHRHTVLRMGSVLAVLAITLFGMFYHATGVTTFAWLCVGFGGTIAAVAAWAWRRPAVGFWVQVQIGLCIGMLTLQLVLQGGVANDTAKWMLCAPVAMMIGG